MFTNSEQISNRPSERSRTVAQAVGDSLEADADLFGINLRGNQEIALAGLCPTHGVSRQHCAVDIAISGRLEQSLCRSDHVALVTDDFGDVLDCNRPGAKPDRKSHRRQIQKIAGVFAARPVIQVRVPLARRAGEQEINLPDLGGEIRLDDFRLVGEPRLCARFTDMEVNEA